MADRSIIIRIGANVTGLTAGLRTAQRAAGDFTSKTLDGVQRNQQAVSTLSTNIGVVGLALTGLAAVAVRSFANFDAAMSNVAATGDDARGSIDELRAAALKAGADTVFSATEAADAVTTLAKAGVSAADILKGGLRGSLDLAAAGTLEVADAAEIAATTLNQFELSGNKSSHVADVLAAAAGKAMGEVSDMASALKFVGPVAHQMGVSLEETAGTIAYLAQQGVLGEQAGTSLRGMLTALTSPSKIAAEQMSALGMNVYDANGQFVGLRGIAEQLKTTMSGLTNAERDQALGRIFGNEQITTARLLYQGGAAAIDQWTKAVDDQGYAAEVAATKMNNLKGDLEQLRGSLETALIGMGEGANGPLRWLVQGLTNTVNALGELPGPIQQVTLALVGGGGLILLGVAGMGKLMVSVAETRAAMAALGVTTADVKNKMKTFGRAAGVVATVTAGFAALTWGVEKYAASQARAVIGTEQTTAALLGMQNAADLDYLFKGLGYGVDEVESLRGAVKRLTDPDLMDRAQDFSGTVRGIFGGGTTGADKIREQFGVIGDSLAALVDSGDAARAEAMFGQIADQWEAQGGKLEDLQALMPAYSEALAGVSNEATLAVDSGEALATATQYVGQSTEDATKALEDWRAMVAESDAAFISLTDGYQAVIDKNTTYAQSTADATETSKDSWEDYYDGVAVSAADYIAQLQAQVDAQAAWEQNMLTLTARVRDGMTGDMKTAGEQMIDELLTLGPEGAAQVQLLKDMSDAEFTQVVALWSQKGTQAVAEFTSQVELYRQPVVVLDVEMKPAYDKVTTFINAVNGMRIGLNAAGQQVSFSTGRGNQTGHADGGAVYGPGTSTSDSVLTRLSAGEHVMTAAEVDAMGGQSAVYRMRAAIRAGWTPGLAHGGAVPGYAAGGQVMVQRQYVGVVSSGPRTSDTAMSRDPIDYDRLARAMAHVTIGLDGRRVSQSVGTRLGEGMRW